MWPLCRPFDDRVLRLVDERMTIVDVTELHWSPARTLENYNRFYRAHLVPPYRTSVVHDKGRGPVMVITFVDPKPEYAPRPTFGGMRTVSTRVFDIKAEIRAQIPSGPSLHSADSPEDARRELMMLLGRDLPDPGDLTPWNGRTRQEHRDLVGADGWASVDELLRAFDAAGPYVVLRNFEELPDNILRDGHGDIDVLTSAYRGLIAMARARPVTRVVPPYGGRFHVDIDGRPVLLDIRLPGDGYFPTVWEERLLATRRRYRDIAWVPSEEESHASLLYHAIVHKKTLNTEYRSRLDAMAIDLGRTELVMGDDPARPRQLLADALDRRGVTITGPKDPTVYFNHRVTDARFPLVMRLVDALHRRAYRVYMRYLRWPTAGAATSVREWILTRFPKARDLGRRVRVR